MQPDPASSAASQSDRIEQLALRLLALAGDQEVRTIEALASVLMRQQEEDRNSLEDVSSASESAASPQRRELGWDGGSERAGLCRRIARRAVRGSLGVPINGANAFHRFEASPLWARRTFPVAAYGSFLFYRL